MSLLKEKFQISLLKSSYKAARPVLKGVEMTWPTRITEINFVTIEH
jgi:hypothetical protein